MKLVKKAKGLLRPIKNIGSKETLAKLSNNRRAIFIASFVLIGISTLLISQAASFSVGAEAESGTRQGGVTQQTDSNASGGGYIRFGSGSPTGNPPVTTGQKCSVILHGAGYYPDTHERVLRDNPYNQELGIRYVIPYSGYREPFIETFWPYDGPHDFGYDPDNARDEAWYQQYVQLVRREIETAGCGPTYIEGGSNGGAFLAKMFCRGEDFGGRIWAVYMKDPVMDTSVLNCNPSNNIRKAIVGYSDEMADQIAESADNNYRCSSLYWSWYCNNDTTMTVAEYTRQINLHGKYNVPVIKIARKHIYEYYPISDQMHLGWGSQTLWWIHYWQQ